MGMMKNKKFLQLSTAALALILLCGCASTGPSSTESTKPTRTEPTQQTQPTQPSEPSQPTLPDEPAVRPELEAVTYLTCTQFDVFPRLLSLGNGLVVASRNTYNPVQGLINELQILDVYGDKVVAKAVRAHAMELVPQIFSGGQILLAEADSGKFYIYDRTLTVKGSFAAPELDGYFDPELKSYYYVQDETLYCMDVASGSSRRLDLGHDLRIDSLLGIHPDNHRLVARVYLSDHGTAYGLAVITPTTGKIWLLRDDLTHVWLVDDQFYGVEMNATQLSYDVYFGSLEGGTVSRIPTTQLYAPSVSYGMMPRSHYLVRRLTPDEGQRSTLIYDLANGGAVVGLGDYGFEDGLYSPEYLEQERMIFGYYSIKEEKTEQNPYPKETFHPVLIDLQQLTFGQGLTPGKSKWQQLVDEALLQELDATVSLPEELSEVRSQADALEKKYGIRVLLGKQTQTVCDHSAYQVAVNSDPQQIRTALLQLEQALEKYPAGFFRQLRSGAEESGLSVCLTGSIKGNLSPSGFSQVCRDKYEVVLNITAGDLEKTIHHELWHSIESHLSADIFRTPQWDACNPEGFAYYGGYDKGYLQLTQWTLEGGSGAASHFVNAYGRINAMEDRAVIMERVMTGDGEALLQSAALKEKLSLIADAIRGGFDTAGWSDVYWEQLLQ